MNILIAPFCRPMRNGKKNPKNFPYWQILAVILEGNGHKLIQVGSEGELQVVSDFRKQLSFRELKNLILECDMFISVDTWIQHAAHHYGKRGIVIFGQSDPAIFGYPENVNLLKDKKYLRKNQFWLWEQAEYNRDAFVTAEEVAKEVDGWKNYGQIH